MANAVAGGWSLNGALTLQTGPVLAWGNVLYYGGPLQLRQHEPDISRFNRASGEQLSDNIRTFSSAFGNLRRDPTKNVDLSLAKKTAFGERRYVEIRFETLNTTNRVTMGAPNLTPTSTAFGTIATQANTPRRVQTGLRVVW